MNQWHNPYSWIFLPFQFGDTASQEDPQLWLAEELKKTGAWENAKNELRYFLRYVADSFQPYQTAADDKGKYKIIHLKWNGEGSAHTGDSAPGNSALGSGRYYVLSRELPEKGLSPEQEKILENFRAGNFDVVLQGKPKEVSEGKAEHSTDEEIPDGKPGEGAGEIPDGKPGESAEERERPKKKQAGRREKKRRIQGRILPVQACLDNKEVQLFLFGTGIGILALKFRFTSAKDPLRPFGVYWKDPENAFLTEEEEAFLTEEKKRSAAETKEDIDESPQGISWQDAADVIYELKRCSDGHMYLREEKKKVSMIELGMEILGIPEIISGGDFFFYSADTAKNAGSIGRGGREANFGRASMLTYVELQDFEKEKEALFYLRYGNSTQFPYFDPEEIRKEEILDNAPDIRWGLCSEGAVCALCTDCTDTGANRGSFLRGFFVRLNSTYLLMHVLLLHQKYALYKFLIQLGAGHEETLQTLEHYREQLYEFRRYYVYSRISDVIQYERLYERMCRVFMLDRMYEDVNEPLEKLHHLQEEILRQTEERRRAEEEKQHELEEDRSRSFNTVSLIISILCVSSAMVDCMGFMEYWGEKGSFDKWWFMLGFIISMIMLISVISYLCYQRFSRAGQEARRDRKNSR